MFQSTLGHRHQKASTITSGEQASGATHMQKDRKVSMRQDLSGYRLKHSAIVCANFGGVRIARRTGGDTDMSFVQMDIAYDILYAISTRVLRR